MANMKTMSPVHKSCSKTTVVLFLCPWVLSVVILYKFALSDILSTTEMRFYNLLKANNTEDLLSSNLVSKKRGRVYPFQENLRIHDNVKYHADVDSAMSSSIQSINNNSRGLPRTSSYNKFPISKRKDDWRNVDVDGDRINLNAGGSSKNFRDFLRSGYNRFPSGIGKDNQRNGRKYFIYRCDGKSRSGCGGWVDRLKGVMAAYIIANITGRTFLVDIKSHDCNILDYVVPNRVNWSFPVSLGKRVAEEDSHAFDMNMVNSIRFYNKVSKINFKTHPSMKHNVVYFKANLDYNDGFRSSKFHQAQLSWMANLTRDQIMGAIFKRLMKPSPRIQHLIDHFLNRAVPKSEDKLACAHIRMGINPTIPHDTVLRNTPDVFPVVWKFLNKYNEHKNYKIFLMSDSQEALDDAKRQPFGDKLFMVQGDIGHIERSRGVTDEALCKSLEKVILEQFILMHCDVLMISKSGVSRLAAYVRGSDEGLYCLVNGTVTPCQLRSIKELYRIVG